MKKDKISKTIHIIFSVILLFTLAEFIAKKQHHFAHNTIAAYLLYLIFVYFENRLRLNVKVHIKALVMATIAFHSVLGQFFNLYHRVYWFDSALHLFGSFSFSIFYYAILFSVFGTFSKFKVPTFLFITSVGVMLGVLFELIEFITDILLGTHHQDGLKDTNIDLIFDMLGSILAGLLGTFKEELFVHK